MVPGQVTQKHYFDFMTFTYVVHGQNLDIPLQLPFLGEVSWEEKRALDEQWDVLVLVLGLPEGSRMISNRLFNPLLNKRIELDCLEDSFQL